VLGFSSLLSRVVGLPGLVWQEVGIMKVFVIGANGQRVPKSSILRLPEGMK